MNNRENEIIEQLAADVHEGAIAKSRELFGEGMGDFIELAAMQDLFNADKFGYILYRLIFTGGSNIPVFPEKVVVSQLVEALNTDPEFIRLGAPTITADMIEDKIRELSGMVVVQPFAVGVLAMPVISIIAHVRCGEDSAYLFGGHGFLCASPVAFAFASAKHMGKVSSMSEMKGE